MVEKERIGLIEIKLDETKDVVSTYFDIASLTGDVMSPSLKLSFDSFTDKVLQGRFYSEREDRAFRHSYALDIRFNTAITTANAAVMSGK